jgi:hypothetical protein
MTYINYLPGLIQHGSLFFALHCCKITRKIYRCGRFGVVDNLLITQIPYLKEISGNAK